MQYFCGYFPHRSSFFYSLGKKLCSGLSVQNKKNKPRHQLYLLFHSTQSLWCNFIFSCQLAVITTKMVYQSIKHLLQLPEKKGTRNLEVSILCERSPAKYLRKSRSLTLGEQTGEENRACDCSGDISTVTTKSRWQYKPLKGLVIDCYKNIANRSIPKASVSEQGRI